jgi:hypothetical protein
MIRGAAHKDVEHPAGQANAKSAYTFRQCAACARTIVAGDVMDDASDDLCFNCWWAAKRTK